MSNSLMTSRRFAPLFWCQFFSAFNDNFLKNALVFLILFKLGASQNARGADHARGRGVHRAVLLPLRPRRPDRRPLRQGDRGASVKLAEIGVAALAVVGFWLHSIPILFVALFLFGVIAALFGPIKYGILPDHLKQEELPAGNALVEGATFMAILLGTIVGGLAAKDGGHPAMFGAHDHGVRAAVLGREPVHPARPARARPISRRPQHRALDRRAAEATCGATSGCGGAGWSRAGSGWSARSCCRCCRRW